MATTDVLTAAEARQVVGVDDTPAVLTLLLSAVSDQLDQMCGPVVQRTITAEMHNGGSATIFLIYRPVSSVTSVTEYTGTSAQALAAESNTAKTGFDYMFEPQSGVLRRRSSNSDACFAAGRGNVTVTYVAGRYASTDAVGAKWKEAAALMLRHLWTSEMASGSETFGAFTDIPNPLLGPGMLNKVASLLSGEMLAPNV